MNKTNFVFLALVGLFCAQVGIAQPSCSDPDVPTQVTLDLSGVESWDGLGSGNNVVLQICDPTLANKQLSHIAWDNVVINTVGASWCSEAVMAINLEVGGGDNGVFLTVNVGDTFPGNPCPTAGSGGFFNLNDFGIPVFADANGCMIVEFFESFDDVSGAVDAIYQSGTLTMAGCGTPVIPTLGEWGLIILGLFIVIFGVVYLRVPSTRAAAVRAN